MAQNPAGYVPVFDGGAPRIISGYAREAMSGGQLAYSSGTTTATVSSGLNSFVTGDVLFAAGASGGEFNGVVVTSTVGSNSPVAIATRGMFICTVDGDTTPGNHVMTQGGNAIAQAGSVAGNVAALNIIGRALTGAGSEGYAIVNIYG